MKNNWLLYIAIPCLAIAIIAVYLTFRSETINFCAVTNPTKITRFTYFAQSPHVDRQSTSVPAEMGAYCDTDLTITAFPKDFNRDQLGNRSVTVIRFDGNNPQTIAFYALPNQEGQVLIFNGRTYLVDNQAARYPAWPITPTTRQEVPKI